MLGQKELDWLRNWKKQISDLRTANATERQELQQKLDVLNEEGGKLDLRMQYVHGLLVQEGQAKKESSSQAIGESPMDYDEPEPKQEVKTDETARDKLPGKRRPG